MLHRDSTILTKILNETNFAIDALKCVSFEDFNENEILKRAICMTVINIGELVKSLSDDFRSSNKHIPWRSIAGFRDIAAHKYQTLSMYDVYHTVTTDFEQLKANINTIFEK